MDDGESVEGRRLAKGNTVEQNAPRTQSRTRASSALDRVREGSEEAKHASRSLGRPSALTPSPEVGARCDMWRWLICGAQLKFCLEPRLDARLRHINYSYNDRRNAINSGLLAHRLFAL